MCPQLSATRVMATLYPFPFLEMLALLTPAEERLVGRIKVLAAVPSEDLPFEKLLLSSVCFLLPLAMLFAMLVTVPVL